MGQGTAKGSVRFYRRGTEPTAVQSHDKGHSTRLPPSLLRPGPCRTDLRHQLRAHPGGQDIHQQRDERRQTAGPYQWRGEPELRNKTRTFDFHRIIGTLLRPKEIYREDGTLDYRTIGDGYLQEMSMVCQDEYEIALAEGSASEETLEGMRQNIMAIEDAIRNLPAPGEDSTDLIVYEPLKKAIRTGTNSSWQRSGCKNQFTKSRPEEKNPNRNGKHVSTDDNAVPPT